MFWFPALIPHFDLIQGFSLTSFTRLPVFWFYVTSVCSGMHLNFTLLLTSSSFSLLTQSSRRPESISQDLNALRVSGQSITNHKDSLITVVHFNSCCVQFSMDSCISAWNIFVRRSRLTDALRPGPPIPYIVCLASQGFLRFIVYYILYDIGHKKKIMKWKSDTRHT